jgi:uncharacterized protein involved in exopolysaccharide biosynthesis
MKNEFDDFQEISSSGSNFFTEILQRYLPYWPIFLFTILTSLAGTYTYLRYVTSLYDVSAKILLKDDKKGADASRVLDALNIFGEKKIVDNEIQILKSFPLTNQAVKLLNFYAVQSHVGKFKRNELYAENAPLIISALHKDSVVRTQKPILIQLKWARNGFVIKNNFYNFGKSLKINGQVFNIRVNPAYLKMMRAYPEKMEKEISLDLYSIDVLTSLFLGKLNVEASSKQSTILNITTSTTVPKKGEDFINTLISVYNNTSIGEKNLVAKNTLAFLESRLTIVEKELDRVEENIKNFKENSKIVNISQQGQLFLQTVSENDQKLSELKIQLSVLDDVEKYVRGKSNQTSMAPSLLGINDPALANLLQKLYEAELLLSRAIKVTGSQNIIQDQLRDEIRQIKPAILENIQNIKSNIRIAESKVNQSISELNLMLGTIPQKEKLLIDISRQQTIKNSIFNFLLQKREETALSYASTVADSRMVEPARASGSAVSPKVNIIYLIGLAIGICLTLLFVLFRE